MKWNTSYTKNNHSKWNGATSDDELLGKFDPDAGYRESRPPGGREALKEVPEPVAAYGYFLLVVAALIFVLLVIIGVFR